MSKEKASELAERLLDYPEDSWDELIDSWCGSDTGLKTELLRIAAEHRNARNFVEDLQNRILSLTKSGAGSGHDSPETVAGYKVIRKLGEGGSSVVYLVEADGTEAALKLLKRGFEESTYARRRFEAEKNILASLNHPDIARFTGGGITPDGDPYVIMEYADGLPVDVWCRRNRVSLKERLALFQRICRAVHYAHQNLIIHRDLKPENILITQSGDVKLIDFGIAKLVEPTDADFPSFHTRTGTHLMTPEFASPEQVRGEPITTASDIYSLGVLLFLLLTGNRPYEFRTASMLEIERIVCETDNPRPSDAASATRSAPVPSRELKGDLDRIVLMAMWKAPSRRYPSAQALADDLGNYLKGEPVQARTPTLRYRAGKFIARHRWIVVAAAVAVFSLSAGLAGTLWQAHKATQNAAKAELQAERAEHVASFLASLFEESDPTKANDGSTTAREMLDRGFEKTGTELADQPGVQAQMYGIIGVVYNNLGLYDKALPSLERSVQLYREIDDTSAGFLLALREMANLQYRMGMLDDAEISAREALKLETARHGPDHPETASVLNTLAIIYDAKGDVPNAISTLRRVVEIRSQQPEPGSNLAINMNNLAILLSGEGELDEADRMFRRTVELVREFWGDDHPYMAFTLNGYARTHQKSGLYDEAESHLKQALSTSMNVFPETHPFIAVVHHNLGNLYTETEDVSLAETSYISALEIRRQSLPPGHPDIASTLDALGIVLTETGRPAEAETLLREALQIRINAYGDDDWRIAKTEAHLGRCLLRQEKIPRPNPSSQKATPCCYPSEAPTTPTPKKPAPTSLHWGWICLEFFGIQLGWIERRWRRLGGFAQIL